MSFSLQEPLAITNRSCHAEASTEDRVLQTPALSLAAASVKRFTAGAGGSPLAAPQARHRWRQVVISLQSRPRTAWRLRRRSWPLPPPAALPGSELPSFTGPASPLSTPTPRARPSGPVQATATFTRVGLTWGDGTACHLSLPVAWAKGRQGTSLWAALAWCSAPTGHRAPGTLVPLPTAVSIHFTASWLRGCLCRSSVCAWFDCLVDPALWVYGLSAPRPPWSGLALSGPAFLACHARSITSGLSTPILTARVPPSATFTRPISEHPARHNLDALVHPHLPSATASLVAIPQSRRGLGSSPHGKETHRSARGRRDSSPVVAAALPDSLLSFGASSSRLIPRAPVASPELCGLTARLPRISAETRVDDEPPLVIVSPTVSRRGQRLLASPDALELIRADHVAWTALFLLA
ncbi:hypothetical protein Purlil1_5357 [Purpureocillium lilacinum]|uniref:Uncharacterized protein n=1 Tax=Purpureocillium lilacinum TaxID=33203 RepID=A0ABR0C266_PURLI|nr:hypothetical protein Purlil1_5357 [Purpureocillium lilacinum]